MQEARGGKAILQPQQLDPTSFCNLYSRNLYTNQEGIVMFLKVSSCKYFGVVVGKST